ncbi:MAG: glycoside hydrolase family 36 protein [Candidatus Cryptobacteroides sp.]
MKKFLVTLALALLACGASPAQSSMNMTGQGRSCEKWIGEHFAKGKLPPFSFTYNGVPSESFLKKWKFTKSLPSPGDEGEILRSFFWTDRDSGLQVECKVKTFSDFNAMEWVLYFRNVSDSRTGAIADVKAADIRLESAGDGSWDLFYAKGSEASKEDFMARTKEYSVGDSLTMIPQLGRSSSGSFPYFNVKTPSGGMVFAIGWTGTWKAEIIRPSANAFRVTTGLKNLDTYLRPGEEIRTPLTAMIPWQGEDRMDGQNILRQFILRHHYPKAGGCPVQPPVCSGFNYGDPYPCNEYTCLTSDYAKALIHRYEEFNLLPEVFWLDAGWYKKAADWEEGYYWANAVGNWTVDTDRFPAGLGEVADAAHEAGCKLMVWFEPERVVKDSDWAYEHPEYMLLAGGGTPVPHAIDRSTQDSFLFNLGDEQANKWLRESIARLLRENRIDYYRQDYNIDPEWFWYSNDEPGRKGICEIRYITGLYKFWDYLLSEFPDLVIDNCAGGGRRLDLEATSRSIPLWRTDYNYGEPLGYQCHTYGLSQWLPVSGTCLTRSDAFTTRSSYGPAVTFNWKITSADFNILEMRKRMVEFYDIRPYFLEDFYPLTGYGDTTADDIWLAYQLNRKSDGSGRIVAFRRSECKSDRIVVRLRGLDPDAVYVLIDQDTMREIEKSGKELSEGFELSLEQPGSSLFFKYGLKKLF